MIYLILFTTVITFSLFGFDKWRAIKHKRRISELSLYTMTFLGGTFGAIMGILIFRHKISKKIFLIKIGLIIIVQIIIVTFLATKVFNKFL